MNNILNKLPGFNCGICGYTSCEEFAYEVAEGNTIIDKCVNIKNENQCNCSVCSQEHNTSANKTWKDSLKRQYDFILETFEDEPGPRETILPYNPMMAKDLELKEGDIILGRPMGMSCGCPITHCGYVMKADYLNGVIDWCVTGPLRTRNEGFKDIGYYVAHGYEGLVYEWREELHIGQRYWFMPRRCMLQWRHSGLVNTMAKHGKGFRVRVEGLMIG